MSAAQMPELGTQMRLAMRRMGQSVAVISTRYKGQRFAMAVTAVNSLSLDPPSMLVSVNRAASIFPALRAASPFCINILGQEHRAIAECCGGGQKGEARFAIGDWLDEDIPNLADAQARLFCQPDGWMAYGTHGVVIGRVLRADAAQQGAPLIHADGAYRQLGA